MGGLTILGVKLLNFSLDIIVALIGASLPFVIKGSATFFSLGNSFAGGVFLTVGIVHMLPDAMDEFSQYLSLKGASDGAQAYPWTMSLAVFGCLLTLMFEKLKPPHAHHDNEGHNNNNDHNNKTKKHAANGSDSRPYKELVTPLVFEDQPGDASINNNNNNGQVVSATTTTTETTTGPSQEELKHTRMPAMLLLIVLSLHSFLAGLAVGTAETVADGVALMVAIVAHKGFAAFALGIAIRNSSFSRVQKILEILVFTFMTPLGIVTGIILTVSINDSVAMHGVVGVVEALACGTFITVALEDIIGDEMKKKDNILPIKFAFVFIGWLAMSIVAWWT